MLGKVIWIISLILKTSIWKFKNRTFSGFAADEDYKNQAKKLINIIKNEKGETVNLNERKIICISYDAPYILVGRRNEVQLIFK